ncbi:MAG: hypothetical protein Q8K72_08825, partial [Acidimicrobiales bacterium]|nr:hypothetical protein [Acidimicrobiales bacterium]
MAIRALTTRVWTAAAIGGGLVVAVCLLGYGNDIDVANVLRSGHRWLDDGAYRPSRPPGSPVHELGTAFLDRLGGSVAVAAASVAFGALAAWATATLVGRGSTGHPLLGATVLVANPWFLIAGSSLNDAVWALGLALAGCVATARGQRVAGGVLFGLAIGCRSTSAVFAAAWLIAERCGARSARTPWRATRSSLVAATVTGLVCVGPAWWGAGRSLDFLDADIDFVGWSAHLGRWGVKNLVVATVPGAVALAYAGPSLLRSLRRWTSDPVVRFAVVLVVLSEAVFFRFPLKPVHLLPVVAAVVLLLAGSRRAVLIVVVAAQVVGGLVSLRIAVPDTLDRATGADIAVALTAGPVVEDLRCRLRDRDRGPWPAWSR